MNIEVKTIHPPVVKVVESVTITLTQEEARLFALVDWFGPKAHIAGYSAHLFSDSHLPGTIVGSLPVVEDGAALRDLLRVIARRISNATK